MEQMEFPFVPSVPFWPASGSRLVVWGDCASLADQPSMMVGTGRTLAAWCAWDTLFLAELLGETTEIESVGPVDSAVVRLTVAPERVERVEPVSAQMSILLPEAQEMQKNVVTSFCHFVHFFPSRDAAESWIAKHAGTLMLSIHEAHVLARLKNQAQYRDVLR